MGGGIGLGSFGGPMMERSEIIRYRVLVWTDSMDSTSQIVSLS